MPGLSNSYTPNDYVRNWLNSVTSRAGQPQRDDHYPSQTRHTKRRRSDVSDRHAPPQDDHRPGSNHRVGSRPVSSHGSRNGVQQPVPDNGKDQSKVGIREETQTEGAHPVAIALADRSHKYARRSRHKTKADRYEYKDHQTVRQVERGSKPGKNSRATHKKAGATLNQEFKAPNVESNRVTLKQGAMPGFFAKGKASDPTVGRGIPDLTFSEMTFLSRKRQLDNARFRGVQATKTKANDCVAEISEYFADQAGDQIADFQFGSRSNRGIHNVSSDFQSVPSAYAQEHGPKPRGRIAGQQSRSELDACSSRHKLGVTATLDRSQLGATPGSHRATDSPCPSWSTSPARGPMLNSSRDAETVYRDNLMTAVDSLGLRNEALWTINPKSSASNATPPRQVDTAASLTQLRRLPLNRTPPVQRQYYSLDDLKVLAESAYQAECRSTTAAKHADEAHDVRLSIGTQSKLRLEPAAQTIMRPNQIQRPLLARADLRLMPSEQAKAEETNMGHHLLREDQRCAVGYHNDHTRLESRIEPERGCNPDYERCFGVPLTPVAEMVYADWHPQASLAEGELDQFDAALLQNIRSAEMADRLPAWGENAQDHWPAVADAPSHDWESSRTTKGSIFRPIAGAPPSGDRHPVWTQLLRPSQQQPARSPPFSGFKRPFLQY